MEQVLAWIAAGFAAIFGVFSGDPQVGRYYGYAEGDYVYVAPDTGGVVATIAVADGDPVTAGAALFTIDDARAGQAVAAAEARLAAARASLSDLESGQRPEEIEVIEQSWLSALDNLRLARETFDRTEALRRNEVASASRLDADRAALSMAQAEVNRLDAELKVARLPARADRIETARQEVAAAEADRARAGIDHDRLSVVAPVSGQVERVFLDPGEYAAPGTRAVSILPDGAIKFRFFVPEPERTGIALGQSVLIDCTSCVEPVRARVSWLSSEAEHTPPVIYSREERAKLVFAAEARPDGLSGLMPGQPVDVSLAQ